MDTMQADALRRAQELHSAAERSRNEPFAPPKRAENKSKSTHSEPLEHPANFEAENRDLPAEGGIFADKEKLLILALILILSTEQSSDPALTLALLYLII